MKRLVLLGILAACVLAADLLSPRGLDEGRFAHPPSPALAAPTSAPAGRSAAVHSAEDTTRHLVRVGEAFVTQLPDTLAGRPVTGYVTDRTPTTSWLTGTAFFWRPRPADAGTHRLVFRPAGEPAPPETVTLILEVE